MLRFCLNEIGRVSIFDGAYSPLIKGVTIVSLWRFALAFRFRDRSYPKGGMLVGIFNVYQIYENRTVA